MNALPGVKSIPSSAALLLALCLIPRPAWPSAISIDDQGRAQGEALICRFVGRFIKVSLPDAPIEAVPLDLVEANFVLAVQVDEVREGHLPDGWKEQIAFAIHSPTLFFGGRGIETPANGEAPPGKFVFSLWQRPKDKRFALDVEPAPEEPAIPPAVFSAVAERYYALLDAAEAQEAPARKRSQQAMWKDEKEPLEVPAEATGIVVDLESRPVAGAHVEVEGADATAQGETGPDGTFRIALHDRSYRMLALVVTAPGYDRWAFTAFYGGVIGERVQLSKTLSTSLQTAVTAEPQPERRVWLLLEIVGNRPSSTLDPIAVFAGIGDLRSDLRALVASRAFERQDDMNDAPADRARQLLAWWGDPADADLLTGWIEKQKFFRASLAAISAPSAFEVCSRWAEEHFRHEGVADHPPWHTCSPVSTDPSGTHTLLRFQVRYAYWGYSQLVVAIRENDGWHLRRVADWEHYHESIGR